MFLDQFLVRAFFTDGSVILCRILVDLYTFVCFYLNAHFYFTIFCFFFTQISQDIFLFNVLVNEEA